MLANSKPWHSLYLHAVVMHDVDDDCLPIADNDNHRPIREPLPKRWVIDGAAMAGVGVSVALQFVWSSALVWQLGG